MESTAHPRRPTDMDEVTSFGHSEGLQPNASHTDPRPEPEGEPGGRPVSVKKIRKRGQQAKSRISVACLRCQRRKIRCDGLLPSCSGCQKAGVDCADGGSHHDLSRTYVANLESRVEWLEAIIKQNCPEIDLRHGPGVSTTSVSSSRLNVSQDGTGPNTADCSNFAREAHQEVFASSNSTPEGTASDQTFPEVTQQIGLVSVTAGADLRYVGPSSGLFFTKYVLACIAQRSKMSQPSIQHSPTPRYENVLAVPPDLLLSQPEGLPTDMNRTMLLSQAYFESVHLQHPFLHQPSHMDLIQEMYNGTDIGAGRTFQVFMVLAVGATILSRRAKVPLSAEGFCASAMGYLDNVFLETSLIGVQCTLLLQMYTINNPSSGLNIWSLHYHCLASLLELGLQRDIRAGSHFSILDQELRTRAFWCIYAMDRVLSTIMGRPIGLMDEACELRLPADVNDGDLQSNSLKERKPEDPPTNMSNAIHLFKLARLNSEIKGVLYCVDRQHPPYTQPIITDVHKWKDDMLHRLHRWRKDIPRYEKDRCYIADLSEIKYHGLIMLLLRPGPLIEHPSKESLRECFQSAVECGRIYERLYRNGLLAYSWISVHSLFLSVITMLFCVWSVHGIAEEVEFDILVKALKAASDILSATGEHWPEAKRSRDVLDQLSTSTIRWFALRQNKDPVARAVPAIPSSSMGDVNLGPLGSLDESLLALFDNATFPQSADVNQNQFMSMNEPIDSFVSPELFSRFLGLTDGRNAADSFGENGLSIDNIMEGMFWGN